MKGVFPLLVLVAGCAGTPAAVRNAPEIELTSLDGTRVFGRSLWEDRSVLLVFMTTWCGSCRAEIPLLNRLAERTRVVGILTGDTRRDAVRFGRETGARFQLLLDDGRAAKAFDIVASPTIVVVERGGAIRHRGDAPPADMR